MLWPLVQDLALQHVPGQANKLGTGAQARLWGLWGGGPRLAGPLWPMQALSLSPSRPGQRLSRPPPPAPFWPLISLTEPCYL